MLEAMEAARRVYHYLYDHEMKHLLGQIHEIVNTNDRYETQAGRQKMFGFLYQGTNYRLEQPPVFHKRLPVLHESLEQSLETILQDMQDLGVELQQIKQLVVKLVFPCEDDQQIRDALPEALLPAMGTQFQNMRREREPAFTIVDDPRAMALFEKLSPRIEYFTATRFIL